jgi:uncharacterized protein YecE (DUF72 family)
MSKSDILVGTSGWVYKDWQPGFYPKGLKGPEWLSYYAKIFRTTEINNSFYRLPEAATFDLWRKKTPENFVFSVKLSRYITHIKRLKNVKKEWNTFQKRVSRLKDKCGPILVQFPSSFVLNSERLDRLRIFLEYATKDRELALEFRDLSWSTSSVYDVLQNFGAALVQADSSKNPKSEMVNTSDIIYFRMHGPKGLFDSKYSYNKLKDLAKNIESLRSRIKSIYVYFNNDFHGYAIDNARTLISLL